MARLFNDASSQYVSGPTPITASPFTINAWFNTTRSDSFQTIAAISTSGSADHYWWMFLNPSSQLRFRIQDTGSPLEFLATPGTYSTDTWHMATIVEAAPNDHRVYLDGANKATQSASRTPTGANTFSSGLLLRAINQFPFSGRVCEIAKWNVVLSDAEIATLYDGGVALPPWLCQPDSLLFHYPLLEEDGDINWIGDDTYDLTNTNGPTYGEHVPLLDELPIIRVEEEAAPIGGFLFYDQLLISDSVIDINDLSVPSKTTRVELQAESNPVRLTMDGSTDPTQTSGIVLLAQDEPSEFLVEDFKRARLVRGAAADAVLNVHYYGSSS